MAEKIKVLTKVPGEDFRAATIENSLKAMQKWVGGYIEAINVGKGLIVICNEEGIYEELPYNCQIGGYGFLGNIIVCTQDGEEFADMPESVWEIIKEDQDAEDD